jgi:maleate cis-trans isomerase
MPDPTSPAPTAVPAPVIAPWYQLGYIIPHRQTDLDAYQFYRVAPEGMMLVTTGMDLAEYSLAAVESQLDAFHSCVDLLAKKPVDRIALSGVPVASVLGRRRMRALLAEASDRTGIACDTDLEAHIATLQQLGAERIALASRWPDAVNAALTAYLAEAGIEVVACRSRSRDLAQNKAAHPLADHDLAIRLGSEVLEAAPHAQALLMPGGLWFAIHAVPVLEAKYRRPVLLNILSTTACALRSAVGRVQVAPDARWGRVLADAVPR